MPDGEAARVSRTVVITDCDFGSGEIEHDILAPHGITVHMAQCRTPAEVIAAAEQATGLLVQYAPVTAEVLAALPSLQAVVRFGVGLDTIDLAAAERKRVLVSGVTDYCTDEVADHGLGLILACLRSICWADSAIKRGQWPTPTQAPLLTRLSGTEVGLIGFGRTAKALGRRLRACGAVVKAYDPHLTAAEIEDGGAKPVDRREALACAVVSLHLPAAVNAPPFADREVLAQMTPGSVLINTARGSLVDEVALCEALDSGHVGWAGIDVVAAEGPGTSALAMHPRVTATPHVAYYSPQSLLALRRQACHRLLELLARGAPDTRGSGPELGNEQR